MLRRSLLALTTGTLYTVLASQSLPLCLLVGVASVVADSRRNNAAAKGVELDEDLYHRALAHAGILESQSRDGIAERLRRGEAEALFEVANSMNEAGDKISSVLIWHALADDGSEGADYEEYDQGEEFDYEGHPPSAVALGFSYYDVDKPRSLQYFLMATSKKGAPHQAAMFNAGRLYLELEDPSGALAYIRACATLDQGHPAYARPQLCMTCREAYNTLSTELVKNGIDMGLEEAVECFPYANINDFPLSGTKALRMFHEAMGYLEKYVDVVQGSSKGGTGMNSSARKKAAKHLTMAMEILVNFQSSYTEEMSNLQLFLVGYILERITNVHTKLESSGNEEL